VARILLVGGGPRARALVSALAERGHAVRATAADAAAAAPLEEAGAEAVRADPDRLGTLLPHLQGVSALCWLLGSADGDPDAVSALHGPRLETIVETLVDTHVRGVVYEAAGTVPADVLEAGAATVERLARTFHMPVAVVRHPPDDVPGWVAETAAAVDGVLGT
jgi:uncharacterized protein YbjT (DUF2867 family)